ncbi:MAG: murein hydrolase activator EnvC family protein [Hyphomicrobiaceae bacterium]
MLSNLAKAGCTVALLGVMGLTTTLPVGAQSNIDRAEAERKLRQQKEQLKSAAKKESELRDGVGQIERERKEINQRLLSTAALIKKSEGQMTRIEQRISELRAQESLVRGSLSQRHSEVAKLLGALQRMGRNPPPVMVTRRQDALEMVRSAMVLSAAFPGLRKQAMVLTQRLNNLVRVLDDIRDEGAKLRAETKKLNKARKMLAGVMQAKKQTLLERQKELQLVRVAAAEITDSVTDLNELIVKLDQTVTRNTGLGTYEAELKAKRNAKSLSGATDPKRPRIPKSVAGAPQPEKKGPEVAIVVPPKPGQIIEIAPQPNSLGVGNPDRMKPATPFTNTRGQLPLPASGRRIISFGEKTQHGSHSKGMVIETRFSAQVTSPSDGWVVYAGKFRSYGKLLIINAGDGYHILLAGLSNIDVEPGQFVLAAEPVGTMNSANSTGNSGTTNNAPVLYIEFRKGGRPINPDPWWVASHQKAS